MTTLLGWKETISKATTVTEVLAYDCSADADRSNGDNETRVSAAQACNEERVIPGGA